MTPPRTLNDRRVTSRRSCEWRTLVRKHGHLEPGFTALCADCATDLMPQEPSPDGGRTWHQYMVLDTVWAAAGMHPDGGELCLGCLERRLALHITGDDLIDAPINYPDVIPDPPRMAVAKAQASLRRALARLDWSELCELVAEGLT